MREGFFRTDEMQDALITLEVLKQQLENLL